MAADDIKDSSAFEKLIEHVFVSELLQELWFKRGQAAEVLRAEVDSWGYDIVVELDGIVRHIQLKATRRKGKTRSVPVNEKLADKPGGCVVWLFWNYGVGGRLEFDYRWFGGVAGEPCPSLAGFRMAKRSTANAQGEKPTRRGTRKLPLGECEKIPDIQVLCERLFGPPP